MATFAVRRAIAPERHVGVPAARPARVRVGLERVQREKLQVVADDGADDVEERRLRDGVEEAAVLEERPLVVLRDRAALPPGRQVGERAVELLRLRTEEDVRHDDVADLLEPVDLCVHVHCDLPGKPIARNP
jgi:hypothetical protein